jgi:hypothetical protein
MSMADTKTSGLPVLAGATIISSDYLHAVIGGVSTKVTFADLLIWMSANNVGSGTAAPNLMKASTLFSTSLWSGYWASGTAPVRASSGFGITTTDAIEKDIYQNFLPADLPVGKTYTFGFTATLVSGTGISKASAYFEGPATNLYAPDPAPVIGVPYRSYITFTIPATGTTAVHTTIICVGGPAQYTYTNITLVAGSTDMPNAV